jgi:hypothetical protein
MLNRCLLGVEGAEGVLRDVLVLDPERATTPLTPSVPRLPLDLDLAASDLLKSENTPCEGGLARTRLTYQRYDLSGRHRQ